MAQKAICQFLEVRFGESSLDLRNKVKQIERLGVLDRIINKIYTAASQEEAEAVINSAHTKQTAEVWRR